MAASHSPHSGQSGFTLPELIAVMVLIGILAFVALPRFMDKTFDEVGFHDSAKAALQHARRTAIASRRYVCVNVATGNGSAASLSLFRDNTVPESVGNVGCTPGCVPNAAAASTCFALTLPAPGRSCAANQVCAPSGVSITAGNSVIFDPQGRAVANNRTVVAAAPNISISNQPAITVQPETGIVQ